MPRLLRCGLCLLWLLLLCPRAHAKTVHVNGTSANLTNCTAALSTSSPIVPIKTINEGIRCLAGGDTLLIASGTYDERISSRTTPTTVEVPNGLSATQMTNIWAAPGATVWLRPVTNPAEGAAVLIYKEPYDAEIRSVAYTKLKKFIHLKGLNVDGALLNTHGVMFDGDESMIYELAEIKNATTTGVLSVQTSTGTGGVIFRQLNVHHNYVDDANAERLGISICGRNKVIERNHVHHNRKEGIRVHCPPRVINNVVVRYNLVEDQAGGPGILVQCNASCPVHDNVLLRNAIGIQITGLSVPVFNNSLSGFVLISDNYGILIQANSVVLKNNLILDQRKQVFAGGQSRYIYSAGYFPVVDKNLCDFNATGCSVQETDLSKIVVSHAAGNLRLAAGSKAINAGAAQPFLTADYDGTTRPQDGLIDIGAFEYETPSTLPPIYHVSPAGEPAPTRSCTQAKDSGTPLKTINEGIACLGPGETVRIASGTYNEILSNIATAATTPIPSGSAGLPTRIEAMPGATVLLKPLTAIAGPIAEPGVITLEAVGGVLPAHITMTGVQVDANHLYKIGALLNGNELVFAGVSASARAEVKHANGKAGVSSQTGTGVTLRHLDVHHNAATGPGLTEGVLLCGTGKVLEHSAVHHNTQSGIRAYCVGGSVQDITVRYNTVSENAAAGIYINGHPTHTVHDNILLRNPIGIETGNGGGAKIFHNSISGYTPTGNEFGILLRAPATVMNNLLIQQRQVSISGWSRYLYADPPTLTPTLDANLCDYAAPQGCEIVATNLAALVVNAATDDLHLPAGSPAINAGTVPPLVLADIEGHMRPVGTTYDIGAYESLAAPPQNIPCEMGDPVVVSVTGCTACTGPTKSCTDTLHAMPLVYAQGTGTPCPTILPVVTTRTTPYDCDVDCALSEPALTTIGECNTQCSVDGFKCCDETWTRTILVPDHGQGQPCPPEPITEARTGLHPCTADDTCVEVPPLLAD